MTGTIGDTVPEYSSSNGTDAIVRQIPNTLLPDFEGDAAGHRKVHEIFLVRIAIVS